MKIKEFQLDELNRARELQNEMSKLHIPSPVMWWNYEIKNKNGIVIEQGIGKANSYTRNAMNLLTYHIGLCNISLGSESFGDGLMSLKTTEGTIRTIAYNTSYATARTSNDQPAVILGVSTDAETLDNYAFTNLTIKQMGTSIKSSFNSETRKLITTISRMFTNDSASSIDITESGILCDMAWGSVQYTTLMIRDVFTAIALGVGESIAWTYVTEVQYPS